MQLKEHLSFQAAGEAPFCLMLLLGSAAPPSGNLEGLSVAPAVYTPSSQPAANIPHMSPGSRGGDGQNQALGCPRLGQGSQLNCWVSENTLTQGAELYLALHLQQCIPSRQGP